MSAAPANPSNAANPANRAISRSRLRTALSVACLALLLGAITTIVVAWYIVLRVPLYSNIPPGVIPGATFETARGSIFPDRNCRVIESDCYRRPGITLYSAKAAWFSGWPPAPTREMLIPTSEFLPAWTHESLWIARRGDESAGDAALCDDYRGIEAVGWPWPALWRESYTVANAMKHPGGIAVASLARFNTRFPSGTPVAPIFPYRPIPTGFALNTLCAAAIWFVPLSIPAYLRRRRRLRIGLCPSCGYDLRATPKELPCPECGKVAAGAR